MSLGHRRGPRPAGCRCGRSGGRLRADASTSIGTSEAFAARARRRTRSVLPGLGWTIFTSAGKSATGLSVDRHDARRRCAVRPARPDCPARSCRSSVGTVGYQKSNPRPRHQRARFRQRAAVAVDVECDACARCRRLRRRARRARSASPSMRRSRIASTAPSRVRDSLVADGDDRVAGLQAGPGHRRVGRDVADDRLQRRDADDEQDPVGERGKQEIRERAGQQHEDAAPDRLAVDRPRPGARVPPDLHARREV